MAALPQCYTHRITDNFEGMWICQWCDQAKSVWSRSDFIFRFLFNCMLHFASYILQKNPLKLVNWFQRYDQLKDAKNNRKQKTFSALFSSILKSIFPSSDWFCLITSIIWGQYVFTNFRNFHSVFNKIIWNFNFLLLFYKQKLTIVVVQCFHNMVQKLESQK